MPVLLEMMKWMSDRVFLELYRHLELGVVLVTLSQLDELFCCPRGCRGYGADYHGTVVPLIVDSVVDGVASSESLIFDQE